MFDKDRIVKGCRGNNTYNWYKGYMIRTSFLNFQPDFFLVKLSKILEEYFLHFCNFKKNLHLSTWSIYMRSFSLFGAEIKKLSASQKHDRSQVGPCLARARALIEYPIHSNEISFTSFSRNCSGNHIVW